MSWVEVALVQELKLHSMQKMWSTLKKNMNELYTKSNYKPKLVAPEGFFDQDWYTQLL
jgi:hypothetical protein